MNPPVRAAARSRDTKYCLTVSILKKVHRPAAGHPACDRWKLITSDALSLSFRPISGMKYHFVVEQALLDVEAVEALAVGLVHPDGVVTLTAKG